MMWQHKHKTNAATLSHPRSRVFYPVASQSYLFILGYGGGRAAKYSHEHTARRVSSLTSLHHAWRGTLRHAPWRSSRTSAWPWRARRRVSSFTSRLARHSMPRPTALITHQRTALTGVQARISIYIAPGAALYATPHGAHHAPAHYPGGRFGANFSYPVASPY